MRELIKKTRIKLKVLKIVFIDKKIEAKDKVVKKKIKIKKIKIVFI
jgi:hypothetical protein